ncbi:Formate hydrogenlyase subunit 6/NADH:ubiquinone oxidoreductase 23 kD subunit (chain I) [Archaeoglobus sulfaticallidus PM70-1]|uniref:Formate hydrogenlyase subunit 6/NADH:ubiquinone oxidoreductase 23 kD subunit (Chain I) n=2 Tax=Archaeoglobus TaxID=2233 RepID=N0BN91_9EURY|nr:Formate hydrogenlyase subunit 6/NADH:ubiquinone oxidoreductase 23 kD subunit (chain I) [Archaeoglobus sulfaticallidus PM70-1]
MLQPLFVTLKHLVKKPVTVQYPDKKVKPSPRYRGFLVYYVDKCTACLSCERNCPNNCIRIKTRKENKKRIVEEYIYFAGRCMFCGICVEVCPTKPKAIRMTDEYELASDSRTSLVFDLVKVERSKR